MSEKDNKKDGSEYTEKCCKCGRTGWTGRNSDYNMDMPVLDRLVKGKKKEHIYCLECLEADEQK